MQQISIRRAVEADYDALGQVMFRAIHEGESPYTMAQRHAWMVAPNAGAGWAERLGRQFVVLGEGVAGPVGFLSLDEKGYVDLAYILPKARGTGLFAELLREIEATARRRGLLHLTTHASLMAQPAFRRCGFGIDHHETVERNGEVLARAAMSKSLDL